MARGKTLEQREKERPEHGYWIIPPEIYDPLNKEFRFKFDPCPNPKPKEFDGLKVDWKKSNWVKLLFDAGAEVRVVGSHDWIHTKDKTRRKAPRPSFLFILKPKQGGSNSSHA